MELKISTPPTFPTPLCSCKRARAAKATEHGSSFACTKNEGRGFAVTNFLYYQARGFVDSFDLMSRLLAHVAIVK